MNCYIPVLQTLMVRTLPVRPSGEVFNAHKILVRASLQCSLLNIYLYLARKMEGQRLDSLKDFT